MIILLFFDKKLQIEALRFVKAVNYGCYLFSHTVPSIIVTKHFVLVISSSNNCKLECLSLFRISRQKRVQEKPWARLSYKDENLGRVFSSRHWRSCT
jgi:hypothetical protein